MLCAQERPCLASPRPAPPSLAAPSQEKSGAFLNHAQGSLPRRASPRLAPPCHTSRNFEQFQTMLRVPCPARPGPASPCRALPCLALRKVEPFPFMLRNPCRAEPCHAKAGLAAPSPAARNLRQFLCRLAREEGQLRNGVSVLLALGIAQFIGVDVGQPVASLLQLLGDGAFGLVHRP